METTIRVRDEAETAELAGKLARHLVQGDALALRGELGAGKTTFVRHLAWALGVPVNNAVTSPTFTIQNIYQARDFPVLHVDLYRLGGVDELEALGVEDWGMAEALTLVEWADRAPAVMGNDYLELEIKIAPAGEERLFCFRTHGEQSDDLLSNFLADLTDASSQDCGIL